MILVAALLACAAVAAPSDFEAAVRALARGDTEAHGALLRRAAETGNPAAAYDLATLRLSEGADAEAHALLLAAAEAGHPLAMYAVAMQFRSGVGTTVDLSRYVYWLRQGAERGSRDAMYSLSGAYRDGFGVERDDDLWFAWCKRAADAGECNAQFSLARAYDDGGSLRGNPVEALRLYRLAAMNHGGALSALAGLYERGHLVEQDVPRAFRLYLSLAESGDRGAFRKIAGMYHSGAGVGASRVAAYAWETLFWERTIAVSGIEMSQWKALGESLTPEERAEASGLIARLRAAVPRGSGGGLR